MNVKPTETDTATGLERNKLEWHHWLRPAYLADEPPASVRARRQPRRPEGGPFASFGAIATAYIHAPVPRDAPRGSREHGNRSGLSPLAVDRFRSHRGKSRADGASAQPRPTQRRESHWLTPDVVHSAVGSHQLLSAKSMGRSRSKWWPQPSEGLLPAGAASLGTNANAFLISCVRQR